MKQKLARICFIVGIGCLFAAFILGQAPAWFGITATFGIAAAVLGGKWIRVTSALLVTTSVAFVILEIREVTKSKELARQWQQDLEDREAKTAEFRQKFLSISIRDGISRSEAELIAECYFHENVPCGRFVGIQDYGGNDWIIDGLWGYAMAPFNLRIDKRTGGIRSPKGPSYTTPTQIFGSPDAWNPPHSANSSREDK